MCCITTERGCLTRSGFAGQGAFSFARDLEGTQSVLECGGRAGAATALSPGVTPANKLRLSKAVSRCACHRSPRRCEFSGDAKWMRRAAAHRAALRERRWIGRWPGASRGRSQGVDDGKWGPSARTSRGIFWSGDNETMLDAFEIKIGQ